MVAIVVVIMIMIVIAMSMMIAVVPAMILAVISGLAVIVMPAMAIMFVRSIRLVMMGPVMVMMGLIGLARSLLLRLGLSLRRILSLWSWGNCRRRSQSVFSFRCNRGHIAAAEHADAACKPLVAGEEGEGAGISERIENARIDPAGRRHIAVRLGDDAIAALLQLAAAARAAEAGRTVQQDDGGGAVLAHVEIECGAAHADCAGGRQNLVGRGLGIAADPAKGTFRCLNGEFLDGL